MRDYALVYTKLYHRKRAGLCVNIDPKLAVTSEHTTAAAVLVMNMDRILRILFMLWWRHLRIRFSWPVFVVKTA